VTARILFSVTAIKFSIAKTNKTANRQIKRTARTPCEHRLSQAGSSTVLRLLAKLSFRRGGGYDPRPKHMQWITVIFRNILDNIDKYYTIISCLVKGLSNISGEKVRQFLI
jgi:hypothetical protein